LQGSQAFNLQPLCLFVVPLSCENAQYLAKALTYQ
jgi:hypothetical protein